MQNAFQGMIFDLYKVIENCRKFVKLVKFLKKSNSSFIWRLQIYLKRESGTCVLLWVLQKYLEQLFYRKSFLHHSAVRCCIKHFLPGDLPSEKRPYISLCANYFFHQNWFQDFNPTIHS